MKLYRPWLTSLKIWTSSALFGGLVAGIFALFIAGFKIALAAIFVISFYGFLLSFPSFVLLAIFFKKIWYKISEEKRVLLSAMVSGTIAVINFLGFVIWPAGSWADWQFWNYSENIFGILIFFSAAFISTRYWVEKEVNTSF